MLLGGIALKKNEHNRLMSTHCLMAIVIAQIALIAPQKPAANLQEV